MFGLYLQIKKKKNLVKDLQVYKIMFYMHMRVFVYTYAPFPRIWHLEPRSKGSETPAGPVPGS